MNGNNANLIEAVNRQLANAFALTLNYRKYHWEVTGPQFRSLHLMFEEFYNEVEATIDETAERVRMLGGFPIHSPEQIREHASVTIAEPGQMEAQAMLQRAHENVHQVMREQRNLVEEADSDPGTADLFTRLVQIHEKHEWFLRETLGETDSINTNK